MPKVAFKQCDVARAIRAAKSAGLSVTGCEIDPAGTIRVLTGAPSSKPMSAIERWITKRRRKSIPIKGLSRL